MNIEEVWMPPYFPPDGVVKIQVWLNHNDNLFQLGTDFYRKKDFLKWWIENENAYVIQNASGKDRVISILLASEVE